MSSCRKKYVSTNSILSPSWWPFWVILRALRVTSLWEDRIMCYLWLSKHYLMRLYSQNFQICVVPDILLLHQSMHRVSITFLWKAIRMGMMGVHPSGLHHLGDMCLIRHLCPDHHLKTKARVGTLIPRFCWNQPLQGQLILSQSLMTFMPLRHLPWDLLLRMFQTPRTDFLILTRILMVLIYMIRSKSFTRIGMTHLLHHRLDIITWGMEGSCLGTGIIPWQKCSIIPTVPLWNGTIMVAMLI